MEWYQVQSELWQLGIAFDCRANRKRSRCGADSMRAASAAAKKPDPAPGAARAISRHTRKTGRLATVAEGEVPLRLRCHAWLGHGLAPRTFPARWHRPP